MLVCGAASVLLLATGAAIWFVIRPAQRSFRMISSKTSRMVRHGASAMKVVSLHQTHNTLVRTDPITASSCILTLIYFLLFAVVPFPCISRPWTGPSHFHFRVLWVQRDRAHPPITNDHTFVRLFSRGFAISKRIRFFPLVVNSAHIVFPTAIGSYRILIIFSR